MLLAISLVGLPAVGLQCAAADTFVYDTVGGWTVYTDRANRFACFAQASYEGGTVTRLGYEDDELYFAAGDPAWGGVEIGSSRPVRVAFGDEASYEGAAAVVAFEEGDHPPALRIGLDEGETDAFLEQFMQEYSVDVTPEGGETLTLSLGGSYRAAARLSECREDMADVYERSRRDGGRE